MKKIIIASILAAFLFSGCKVFESLKKKDEPTAVAVEEPQTKVFSVPNANPGVRKEPTSDVMYEPAEKAPPVRMQTESFTFDKAEDKVKNESSSYFVIIGSFSSNENANRYKSELVPQGFNPIVLHSETGYYRVCVNSFTNEMEARKRVYQIRTDFPKYADTWLLIKK
ncbi:SPOR domain-containing protein [Sunxiuqinia sp. A32]|uniref:SPOR domain-containing protein n=1 Tax=Sunxiuqinia sp. A32 TaxID=3461496 RepID=UPI0040451AFA